MRNPYKILEIPMTASEHDIKSAFRRLAKVTHPDLNGGNQILTERFRNVSEAYAFLSDPIKKYNYDSRIKSYPEEQLSDYYTSEYSDDIKASALDIEYYIHLLYEQVGPYKKAAMQSLGVGVAWLIGGLLVSGGSYMAAISNGGGTYFVAWGAIIFGGIQAIKSLYNYSRITNLVAEAEAKAWNSL